MLSTMTKISCDKCSGGYIDFLEDGQLYTRLCECYVQRKRKYLYEKRLERSNIPERYLDLNFSDWKNHDDAEVLEFCKRYAVNQNPSPAGLFLRGNAGSGKTFLGTCILKERLQFQEGLFESVPVALAKIADEGYKIDYIDKLCTIDFLILDDLGTDIITEKVQSRIYMIINERYANKKATVITSNIGMGDVVKRYSERVASRLSEFCIGKQLQTQKDWRLST